MSKKEKEPEATMPPESPTTPLESSAQANPKGAEVPAQAASVSPPTPTETAPLPSVLARLEYTGQTAGTIRNFDGVILVQHVNPGDILEPESDEQRQALLDSGHFVATRRRATADGLHSGQE